MAKNATPKTLPEVIADGNQRESLEAVRNHLATLLAGADNAKDAAPLARELRQVMTQIASLAGAGGASAIDELRRKREGRIANAAAGDLAANRQ
jgi:hypothetical protein